MELLNDAARGDEAAALRLAPPVAVEQLVFNPNNSATVTVERLTLEDGSTVVRKVLARDAPVTVDHWAAGANPAHWNYWRREADAYGSRAVGAFEPFLRAPALVGHVVPTDGIEVLYLEDIPEPSGDAPTIEDLGAAAYQLGRAQAACGGSPALEEAGEPRGFTSGSREWLWSYASSRPPGPGGYLDATVLSGPAGPDAAVWNHPVVIEGFGDARDELRRRYGGLLCELPRWRRVLAACPRTFCHLDVGPRNVIMAHPSGAGPSGSDRPSDPGNRWGAMAPPTPVLLDWSFAGLGAVGEDPGQLVAESMLEHYFAAESYGELDSEVWEAYASGLEASGWSHDLRWARLAMCVAALRFVWMPAAMVASVSRSGPTGYAGREGLDLVEVFSRRAAVFQHVLERVDEARSVAGELGLA